MRVVALDHLVLTVRDLNRTVWFYTQALGMEHRTFGDQRHALHFGNQKINLHRMEHPVDPKVKHAIPGTADLCFLIDGELDLLISHLHSLGIEIFEGPGHRHGAESILRSAYCYDPDENLIELAERI